MTPRNYTEHEMRKYLAGLLRAHLEGRGKMPPPWVVTPPGEKTVLGVYLAAPSPTSTEEPWLVHGVLRELDGALALTRVTVEHAVEPTIEVTGHVMRRLPLATIRDQAMVWRQSRKIGGPVIASVFGPKKVALKRGRHGYPDEHYERIAWRAIELAGEGRRDVIRALAKEEKRPYHTVRDWITKARERELLAPVKQGRTDFRPGPNLKRKESDG